MYRNGFLTTVVLCCCCLGVLGNIDHSGRYVAMVPAFQGTANALGPVIGGLSPTNCYFSTKKSLGNGRDGSIHQKDYRIFSPCWKR